jgi:hypothetical protein
MAEQHTTDHRPDIKLSQLIATALAAITAAFLGSRLGTAGTIIGAGLASTVSTVAGALYQHSLDRTSNRVRAKVTKAKLDEPTDRPPATPRHRITWRTASMITVLAFGIGMAAVTGVELLKHGPISGGDNGTTIGSLFGQPTDHPRSHPPTTQPDPPTSTTAPTTTPTTTRPPTTTTTPSPTTTTSPPTGTTTPPTTTTTTSGRLTAG